MDKSQVAAAGGCYPHPADQVAAEGTFPAQGARHAAEHAVATSAVVLHQWHGLRRVLPALGLAVALVVAATPSAQATNLERPSGRLFEAIVAHEVGHCLGYWGHHGGTSSIMRSVILPWKISSGAEGYTPTRADLGEIQASRTNRVAGERATASVSYPFVNDRVPVYNLTGRASAFTAAKRWDPNTSVAIVSVGREPSAGITIKWNPKLAGSGLGARAVVNRWEWNGKNWQVADCTVEINTQVVR